MTTYFCDETYKGIDFTADDVQPADYENCEFVDCIFAGIDLQDFSFEDCSFKSCDFSNAGIQNTAFKNVRFSSCKLIGLQFDTCNPFLLAFSFDSCILNYASFYQLKIPGTSFTNCMLLETDFTETDLSKATFKGCNLGGAMFGNTKLEKADFSGSIDIVLDPDQNHLTGASFDLNCLPGLLQKFGIKIN
ncbi:pentapeptide repeat-containing protein [Maribellus sediminis]|uniref:pentapeptide repeat-containing protein n=1 Tax=Maribellus sediminis TaxID=2696285 RepID=UPI00142F42B2|nr:pentapeptide repeat-containing protein [Maribellus sediminis]